MNQVIKNRLKHGIAVFCTVILVGFTGLEGKKLSSDLTKAIQEIQTDYSTKSGTSSSSGGSVVVGVETNTFAQSEAHLQAKEVQEKLEKIELYYEGGVKDLRSSNELVTPYLNIVAAAINKEVELKNSHYVLYNGTNNEWRVPQDIAKQLYAYRNPLKSINDFTFVRFSDVPSIKAQDFLREQITEWAGVNDNIQEVRDVLISTNLSLFGGVGMQGECTWNYFLTAKSHRIPTALQYYEILKANDISYDIELLANEAKELSQMLIDASKEQTLLQFCIPQDKIDDTAYLAWILGVPYYPKSVALMEERIEGAVKRGKALTGGLTGPIVKKVMKQIRLDSRYQHLHEELKEAVENGDFGIRAFMDQYCNTPWSVKNINDIQARLLVTKDIVLNPESGVKIFSYFTTPRDIQANYLRKLDALIKKIIAEENSKTPEQKTQDMVKNETTLARLKAEEAAAKEAEKSAQEKSKKAQK